MLKKRIKNKKGFVLSDAFIAFTVAVIISASISGILYLTSQATKKQMMNQEIVNIGSSILEEIQSSNITNTTDDLSKIINQTSTGTVDTDSSNHWAIIETDITGNYYKYHIIAKVEKDSFVDDFQVITVTMSWKNDDGLTNTYEMKGFKVVTT